MKTIDISKVPENPPSFSDLASRQSVAEEMEISPEVSHIEAHLGSSTVIVEMSHGTLLTIPKNALIQVE